MALTEKRLFKHGGSWAVDLPMPFAKQAGDLTAIIPDTENQAGFSSPEAVLESTRCFRCDCRKQVSCKLRMYSDEYGGSQLRFKTGVRKNFLLNLQHDIVLYEQGRSGIGNPTSFTGRLTKSPRSDGIIQKVQR